MFPRNEKARLQLPNVLWAVDGIISFRVEKSCSSCAVSARVFSDSPGLVLAALGKLPAELLLFVAPPA